MKSVNGTLWQKITNSSYIDVLCTTEIGSWIILNFMISIFNRRAFSAICGNTFSTIGTSLREDIQHGNQ